MRTPEFWSTLPDRPGLCARVLAPLGAIYARATRRRLTRGPRETLCVPVICVGNLNAGGTGKTPVCIHIAQELSALGAKPVIVSRGYGGTLAGPVKVDERTHTAGETGDEPLLMSAFAPVIIARDRAAGARMAVAEGADVILLDDGFQNPALKYDLSIIVVDAAAGFGNMRCIPAGPLREPASAGLPRADLMIRVGITQAQQRFDTIWNESVTNIAPDLPQIKASLEPLETGMDWQGLPVLAFAGIGRPEKFFQTLKGLGAKLIHTEALADHQPLSDRLMTRLLVDARRHGAQLVTTEKDAARLPPEYRQQVLTLPVRLKLKDPAVLQQTIKSLIQK